MISSMMSRTTISMTTTSHQSSTHSSNCSTKNSNPEGLSGSNDSGNKSLSADEMIEMLKNLAAVNEKLYKWEQSLKKLKKYPDNDINKSLMKDIIDFIDNDKSSTQDKAIYLYGQLAHKCHQQKNFMGAAKAYEKAATLRFDNPNVFSDKNPNDTKTTIQYLESAIVNYDAIHKYRHAGTLHYQCSRILKLMNASPEEVAKHYVQALEYFTMRNHEVKHRKRIDGLKISCYSSNSNRRRWDCSQRCCRDIGYYVAAKSFSHFSNEDSKNSTDNEEYFSSGGQNRSKSPIEDMFAMETDLMPHKSIERSKGSIISITQHNQMKQTNRCIEDRIESAKKLVKKLNKFCPYYEVTMNGEDAGRVFCKICERHLGAVSSTLKNHVNTQEHKQAVEDSQTGGQNGTGYSSSSAKASCMELNRSSGPTNTIVRPTPNPNHLMISNGITGQNSNNTFDFENFDIQWVPSYQPINNSVEYCLSDNNQIANQITNTAVQNRTITNL